MLWLLLLPLIFGYSTINGDLIILTAHNNTGIPRYWIKINDRNIRPLSVDNIPKGVGTGDRISISATVVPEATALPFESLTTPIYVDKLDPLQTGSTTVPQNFEMTSIAFYFRSVCNKQNLPIESYRAAWYNDVYNLQGYFRNCSFQNVKFNESNNIIIGPIDVPCTVNTSLGTFDSLACDSKFVYGIMNVGETYAVNNGYNLSLYTRRIALLPTLNCPWAGLGTIGCGSYCYTWVQNGGTGVILSTFFHELGHNFGLQHASSGSDDYGDASCAMGVSADVTCFNSPHSWILGWSKSIADIHVANAPWGKWANFTVPGMQQTVVNTIRIRADWVAPYNIDMSDEDTFYVSYRTATGYDTRLLSPYVNKVAVHKSTNQLPLPETTLTSLQYLGGAGTIYVNSNYNFVVRVYSNNGTAARVGICVKTQAVETNCTNGLDDDCNGLVDSQEKACGGNSFCGNGVCEAAYGETAVSCPADCPAVCGDGYCDPRGETAVTCAKDCCGSSISAVCGDGVCDSWAGENCETCPSDCMKRYACNKIQYCCGGGGIGMGCANKICSFQSRICRSQCG